MVPYQHPPSSQLNKKSRWDSVINTYPQVTASATAELPFASGSDSVCFHSTNVPKNETADVLPPIAAACTTPRASPSTS